VKLTEQQRAYRERNRQRTLAVRCPTCGAQPGERCWVLTTGEPTRWHAPRWRAGWKAAQKAGGEP
jgi:hypothetical protein